MSDRTQSRAAVVGVSLAVLVVGWGLTRDDSADQAAPPPPPAAVERAEPPPAPARQTAAARTPALDQAAPAPPLDATPLAQALDSLARSFEQGTVRCPLPAGTVPIEMPMPLAQRSGETLIAPVTAPAGRVTVYPRRPPAELLAEDKDAWRAARKAALVPLGAMVWEGAAPGETSSCRWEPPETVRVRGRVAGMEPGATVQIHGCGSVGDRSVADDGTFAFDVQAQSECTLEAGSSGFQHYGTVIHPLTDLTDIVVQSPAVLGSSVDLMITEMRQRAEQSQAELDEYEAGTDAYSEALDDEALGDDAVAILRAWRADAIADLERKLTYQRDTAERFAASQARQQELVGE